jgi:uncharacterized RmlC-like cupin family protein
LALYLKSAAVLVLSGIALVAVLYLAAPESLLLAFNIAYQHLRSMEHITPATFRYIPENTPYDRWLEDSRSSLPVFEGMLIKDVTSIELKPWIEMGEEIKGLYLRFADYQITDGRLLQIPGDGETAPLRHLFEMVVYALDGPGYTQLQQDGKPAQKVEWDRGSIFSIPLNVSYQHFNHSGKPLRLLAVTSFPMVINSWNNLDFVQANPFVFEDRYNGEPDYFSETVQVKRKLAQTNLVPNASQYPLSSHSHRGRGARVMGFDMAGNNMLNLHVSSSPARTNKRAHRHTSDAFILVLSGQGYSVTWPESDYEKRIRVDWQPGTLFAPPTYWYHQHFNAGAKEARYLGINVPHLVRRLGLRLEDELSQDLPDLQREWLEEIQYQTYRK